MVIYLDGIQGDGIINSTTMDLLKWDRGIMNHSLLDESIGKELTTPHFLVDTLQKLYYGYGVNLGQDDFGNFITHGGGWPGYGNVLTRYIEDDITIIVLSNNSSWSETIQEAIANIWYNRPIVLPYKHEVAITDPASLSLFNGKYKTRYWEFELVSEADTIVQIFKSGFKIKFIPESNSKLFSTRREDIQIEMLTASGHDPKFYMILYGVRDEMERLQ